MRGDVVLREAGAVGAQRGRLSGGPRQRWIVLFVLLSGVFAVGLSFTLLSAVLPDIEDEFGIDFGSAQWLVTGPILVWGTFGPILGKAADLYGARRVYLIGFAGATLLFVLTGASWNFPSLLTFRLVGALEGAATAPAAIKFIATVFPPQERSKAIGWESFIIAFSPAFGLLLGTAVVPLFGWRAMFVLQGLLCGAVLVVAWAILPETRPQPGVRLDWAGSLTLAAGLALGLFGVNRAGSWGFGNPVVIICLALAPMSVAAFVRIQSQTEHPLFPLHYFRRRNIWAGLGASALTNFSYLGGFILAAPLLDRVLGYDEGSRLLVLGFRPLTFAVVGAVAGYAVARTGERPMAVAGTAGVALGMLAMAAVTEATLGWWVIASLVITGAGMGLATPAYGNAIVNSLNVADQGVAGGMVASVHALGSSAGIVILVWLQQTVHASGSSRAGTSFSVAYLVAAGACIGAVVLAALIRSTVGR